MPVPLGPGSEPASEKLERSHASLSEPDCPGAAAGQAAARRDPARHPMANLELEAPGRQRVASSGR